MLQVPHAEPKQEVLPKMKAVDARIQPLSDHPALNLQSLVEDLVHKNDSSTLLALYEAHRASAEAFENIYRFPRNKGECADLLEYQLNHIWACAYLCADGLSRTTPAWHDKNLCLAALIKCGFDMGNRSQDVIDFAVDLNANWPDLKKGE